MLECMPRGHYELQKTIIFANAEKALKDESGASAIEYGLIAALVAVVIVGALNTLGSGMSRMLGKVNSNL